MANPFLGELRLVGFSFAPTGWAFAGGQLLSISQNTALFSLLGTYYGGDGRSTFGLPNLQNSVAIGFGQGPGLSLYDLGETGGVNQVTLLPTTTPSHNHSVLEGGDGTLANPSPNSFSNARDAGGSLYSNAVSAPPAKMYPSAVSPFGSGQPHNNLMPFLALNWIIAMQGVFPQRP
jgi:microcystin-dependent protein